MYLKGDSILVLYVKAVLILFSTWYHLLKIVNTPALVLKYPCWEKPAQTSSKTQHKQDQHMLCFDAGLYFFFHQGD